MKTIQRAFATPLHFLKLPIILLALLFNFSTDEPQPISSNTATTVPIGGNYSTRNFAVNAIDIGGPGNETRKLSDIGDNGGGFAPRSILSASSLSIAVIDIPIGGNQSPPPTRFTQNRGQIATHAFPNICGGGTGQTVPRNFKGASLCVATNNGSQRGNQFVCTSLPDIGRHTEPRKLQIGGGVGGQARRNLVVGGTQRAAFTSADIAGSQPYYG
jgi:hypothetical protein